MRGSDVYHSFVGYVLFETNRAVLFQDHFWHQPDWMPKSQSTLHRDPDSQEVVLTASSWICGQKDLVEFTEVLKPEENNGDQ